MPRKGSSNRRRLGYKEKELIFGTWNVRTLFKTGALLSLLSQLKEYRLDITALQETRWQGKDIMDMKSHTLFYSGKEKGTREFGVAFIVERNMKKNVLDFKAVDERICVLRIKTKFQNVSLINVHAPTEEKEETEKEAFYQKVEEIYDLCPSNDIKILLGDLNAKVGKEEIFQGIIGRHSMHLNTNNNGQRLVDFAAARNMVVSSTCFPHKEIHKQTWRSPDGKTNNQIDHILIDKRNASSMLDVKSCRGANSDSDHFLVRAKYRCKIAYSKHELNKKTKKLHIDALREPSTVMKYQQLLEKELAKLETEQAVKGESYIEEEWKQIKEAIIETAEQTIGYQPKPDRRGWFDDECRSALEEKNVAYKKWIDRPTRAKRLEYERLRKVAHKICKSKKRTHIDNSIRNIEEHIKDKHIRNAYKEVGSLKAGFQPHSDLCRGTNDEILSKEEEIKTRWKTYFQDLLTTTAPAEHSNLSDNAHTNQVATEEELEEEPPDVLDIEMVIQSMSNNKSPGIDNIPAELYKKGGGLLINKIHSLIKVIWREEKVPTDWKTNIIVPIYKNKGDKLQCKNYRGISLLCTGYKILTAVINNRLKKYTDHIIGEYQAGFRPGRSTTDQIFTVKNLLEKAWEHNVEIHQIFVDFQKAYDSIRRDKLYAIMEHFGIPNKLIRLTKATMEDSTYHIKIGTLMTDGFKVGNGLKQGDGLAPNLFNIALEYVIRQLSVHVTSTIFYKSVQLIGYADDINIMGRTKRAISEVYGELKEKAKEVGLNINVEKTKAMVQSRRPGRGGTLTVGDHDIEVVRGFKYLGTVLNDVNEETEEIQARILAANRAYSSLQTIFRSKQIHRNNKIRIYKTLIKPILCYGCVTWTLTQTLEQRLNAFEKKVLRRIYGPAQEGGRWRPRWNNELYRLYNDLNIVEDIKIRRLGWAGHVIRMADERIPKKVLNGTFYNTRPVGRPRTRWADVVQRDALQLLGIRGIRGWRRRAENRNEWRQLLREAKARKGL